MAAKTAEEAYRIVSVYLVRQGKSENTAAAAIKKHGKELSKKLGSPYENAMETIVDAFYNMENYAPDGIPITVLYKHIDEII